LAEFEGKAPVGITELDIAPPLKLKDDLAWWWTLQILVDKIDSFES
jgi:hypothetical protein